MSINKKFKYALFVSLNLIAHAYFVTHTYAQLDLDLKNNARSEVQEHRIAGAVVARIENNKLAELFAVNNAALATPSVSENSVFQVGSISKPVTAWAVMTLVRDGKIKLDDPVSKHVSRWQLPRSNYQTKAVTIRRVLSHTAGLTLSGYPGFSEHEPLPSIEASLSGDTNRAGNVRLFQEPGTGFRYSGGGYTLLQLMIEEVSGLPFHQYIDQAVLQPLGMTNSSYLPTQPVRAKRSQAYRVVDEPIPQFHFRARAAAGLHSTADDLAKFVIANLASNSVLPDHLIELMHSEQIDAGFASAGLGFFVNKESGVVGHGGSNLGWRADIAFDKKTKSGLVVLTNSERGERLIPTLKCAWTIHYNARDENHNCLNALNERKTNARFLARIGSLLLVLSAALLGLGVCLKITKRTFGKISEPAIRWALLASIAGLIATIAVLAHTPLGVYLLSGFWGIFSTLHYAPQGSEHLLLGIYALLISLAFIISMTPKR